MKKILHELYDGAVSCEIVRTGAFSLEEAHLNDIFMAREAIAFANSFVVHSEYAGHLARRDASPGQRHKIRVAPFAFPDPGNFSRPPLEPREMVIGTFGVVSSLVKQTDKVLNAFSMVADERADCVLVVAGPPAGPGEYECLQARVDEIGLAERVRLLGYLEGAKFREVVSSTTVAVQLRGMSMGESSASVADCLAAGVPTVATGIGATRELPEDVLVKVVVEITPKALARILLALLDDSARRASMSAAAQAYARERSFEHSAQFLVEEFVRSPQSARGDMTH
jgi:glycosyltransferase involved in cell wall biosynthesis